MNVEVFDKIERARKLTQKRADRRQLMLSFAFATTKMENDRITHELVERVARTLPADE